MILGVPSTSICSMILGVPSKKGMPPISSYQELLFSLFGDVFIPKSSDSRTTRPDSPNLMDGYLWGILFGTANQGVMM